ncbi:MAG TPA: hypothetical protein VK465_02275 [Fibrobacteria bacterium]|nr:hypothetical protein [Fibrobacteria bacterium]
MWHARLDFTRGLMFLWLSRVAWAAETEPEITPSGVEKSPKSKVLEAGTKMLRTMDPVRKLDMYLVGFHPLKENPSTVWKRITSAGK